MDQERLESREDTLPLAITEPPFPDSEGMDCREQRGPQLDLCLLRSNRRSAEQDDEWVVNTSELGIPVSNDPEDIKAFLKQYPDGVVFSTYQSSMLLWQRRREI